MNGPSAQAAGAPAASCRRRGALILLVVTGLVGIYAAAGAWLVPRLLRSAATDHVTGRLGRQLDLGRITFNPFTFTLELRDAALKEADGSPLAAFGRLRVNVQFWRSVFGWSGHFKEILIEAPAVDAILESDGTLNLARLLPPPSDEPPPALRIDAFSVREGRLGFQDRTRPQTFAATLSPITFSLQDFRTASGHQNAYQFAGTTLAGERLSWSGEFTLEPLGSSGRFEIGDLRASTIAAWLQDALPFELPAGALDVTGEYRVALDGHLGLTLDLPALTFRDVAIAPRGAAPDAPAWITLPELALANLRVSLGDRSLQVERVGLRGATARVRREADGSLNLTRLLGAPLPAAAGGGSGDGPQLSVQQAGAAPASNADATAPWRISVNAVEVNEASIDFTDHTTQPAAQVLLAPLNISVQGYRSDAPAEPLRIETRVGIDQGSVLAAGTVRLAPMAADLQLTIDALDLKASQPYLAQTTSLDLRSGTLATQLQIQYLANGRGAAAPQLRVRGDLQVNGFATRDLALDQQLLDWQALQIRGIDWQVGPDRWSIDQIRLRRPYARIAVASDGTLNVKRAVLAPGERLASAPLDEADEDSPEADAAADAALQLAVSGGSGERTQAARADDAAAQDAAAREATELAAGEAGLAPRRVVPSRIREILIENGAANFSDYSLTPNFSSSMFALNGRIAGLDSDPASRARIDLEGNVDRYAPVSISGELNLLSAVSYSDVTLKFANMDLTTFNPYSGKFAGYSIARGKLTTELQYQLDDRRLNAQHHVVLDQLEFGEATESKDAVPLPVKLAVALLKDRHGVIDIRLPVTGSLDDPKFRVAPIVWKAVRGLLRKVVTAPFALVSSLFGGGEDLQYVDFAPGASELAPEQQAKLGKLQQALGERPQLQLDVPLGIADARDEAVLIHAALEAALASQPADRRALPADADPAGARLAALSRLFTTQTGAAPVWPEQLLDSGKSKTLPPELVAPRSQWLEEQLLPRYAAAASGREALARARAERVRNILVEQGGVVPERIFLTARAPEGEAPADAVRMELKLQ